MLQKLFVQLNINNAVVNKSKRRYNHMVSESIVENAFYVSKLKLNFNLVPFGSFWDARIHNPCIHHWHTLRNGRRPILETRAI